ncbi:MAG: glycosyltransferase [Xanthobacteraceae bacterium]
MRTEWLTLLELLAPAIFVFGVLSLGSRLPIERGWARALIFTFVWLFAAWYLNWRIFVTVLPATGDWYEVGWIWLCFAIELLSIGDQFILYVTFLRTSDRHAEANRHEARIRSLSPEQLPWVDIYIPTYNEPLEVLEKTITGALCIDYPNVRIWVLDDGRRPWLKAFCETKGIGYLNRPDNSHAKAGNINHALTQTGAEFVVTFDADFVPQHNFLMRTIGFFVDPEIGIVQIPHAFYNHDPMQANLALRKSLPDEQRFFFDTIMPSRDAWNAAFCCGSNSVIRRAALHSIGDALPTESITEDMLLTMTLLRKGYVTRYLCERLAFGLAPESVDAYFVQRQRWARGAMQIAYLANGPFGRGLTLMQRLLFLPTHWLSLGLRSMMTIVAPIVFLWTGVSPVFDVSPADVIYYFVPMALASAGGVRIFASGQHFSLSSLVQGVFLSFKILPVVLQTLVRPFGHPFKVTPTGGTSNVSNYAREIFWTASSMMGLTIFGLLVNTVPEWRIIADIEALPILAFWSVINVIVLFLVCMLSLQAPIRRGEERLQIQEPIWLVGPSGLISAGHTTDISLSGAGVEMDTDRALSARIGDPIRVFITEVGFVAGTVVRQVGRFLGVTFHIPVSVERDLLIRKLFTSGLDTTNVSTSAWPATLAILRSIWGIRTEMLAHGAEDSGEVAVTLPIEKLPARSLVISPRPQSLRLSELGEKRRKMAA